MESVISGGRHRPSGMGEYRGGFCQKLETSARPKFSQPRSAFLFNPAHLKFSEVNTVCRSTSSLRTEQAPGSQV